MCTYTNNNGIHLARTLIEAILDTVEDANSACGLTSAVGYYIRM